jgi:flagellar biosynthesis protein FliQ
MTAASSLDWLERMLWTATLVGAPVVLTVVIVGLGIAIVQAATQVNDAAVGFAPKLVAVLLCVVVAGEWMLTRLRDFTTLAMEAMAHLGGHG